MNLPPDPPPLPAWPPWIPPDNDALAADLRELEDRLLTDLGEPGFRLGSETEKPC